MLHLRDSSGRGVALTALAFAAALLACGSGGGGGGGTQAPGITVNVQPGTTSVRPSNTFQFTATVGGSADQRVTWSVGEGAAGGSISSGGLYSAPAGNGTFTVVATSIAFPAVSGQATVLVGPNATVSGTITYQSVPAVLNPTTRRAGLDFAGAVAKPVRGVEVEVLQGASSLGKVTTSEAGAYSLSFSQTGSSTALTVLVKARLADGTVFVRDPANGATYTLAATVPSTGGVANVLAEHGFTGSGSDFGFDPARRKSGPFAILDAIYTAQQKFVAADAALPPPVPPAQSLAATFAAHPLAIDWSTSTTNGTFYTSGGGGPHIVANGKAGVDLDEYDTHVVVHEWSHYVEDWASRSDSIGGSHGAFDLLDPRVSFGEGYANAVPSIVLPETLYVDSRWPANCGAVPNNSCTGFGWDVATEPTVQPDDPVGIRGPFSEFSVMRLVFALFDVGRPQPAYDPVALPLTDLVATLTGPQKNTPAFTTIGSFLHGLKGLVPASAGGIDTLAAHWNIGPVSDDYGAGDTNLSSMYTTVTVNGGGATTTLVPLQTGRSCGFSGDIDNNKAANHYFRFTSPGTAGNVSIATSTTPTADIDIYAFQKGQVVARGVSPSGIENVSIGAAPANTPYVVWMISCKDTAGDLVATLSASRP